MEYKSFNISYIGASHIKRGTECQDASISFSNGDYSIIVVCDGHGGDDYVRSSKESDIAKEVALKKVKKFIKDFEKIESFEKDKDYYDRVMYNLKASIIFSWNEKVKEDISKNPFTEEELNRVSEGARKRYSNDKSEKFYSAYGTTMIAVVCTEKYCFAIQIGDGKCIFINSDGEFIQPVPIDEKCFLNVTTSICDEDAIDSFRHIFIEKSDSKSLPVAVFIGTDGVDDSFQNDQQLYELYRTVLYSFSNTKFEDAYEELKNYIPTLSKHGSGDDISIASILDIENIKELDFIKSFEKDLLGSETSETQDDNEENISDIIDTDSINNKSLKSDKTLKIKMYDEENIEEVKYHLEENNLLYDEKEKNRSSKNDFLEQEISEVADNYGEDILEKGNNTSIDSDSSKINNGNDIQLSDDEISRKTNCLKKEYVNLEEINKDSLLSETKLECTDDKNEVLEKYENQNIEEEKKDPLQNDEIPQIPKSKEDLSDENEKVGKNIKKEKKSWKFWKKI